MHTYNFGEIKKTSIPAAVREEPQTCLQTLFFCSHTSLPRHSAKPALQERTSRH